jgi:hypothetical protein
MYRFQNNEGVIPALFNLGALVAMAAILDVQWMKVIALGQSVQLRTIRIP